MQVEAEPKLVGLFDGPLDHQLRHVKLGLVVVEVEDAVLVLVRVGLVGVVAVRQRQEAVGGDAAPPGVGFGSAGRIGRCQTCSDGVILCAQKQG